MALSLRGIPGVALIVCIIYISFLHALTTSCTIRISRLKSPVFSMIARDYGRILCDFTCEESWSGIRFESGISHVEIAFCNGCMGFMATHVLNVTVYSGGKFPVSWDLTHLFVRFWWKGNTLSGALSITLFAVTNFGISTVVVIDHCWLERVWSLRWL